jgi:hypothetical protein
MVAPFSIEGASSKDGAVQAPRREFAGCIVGHRKTPLGDVEIQMIADTEDMDTPKCLRSRRLDVVDNEVIAVLRRDGPR